MVLGLETATIKAPDRRILGVPGGTFFTSFASERSCVLVLSSPPSPELVGVVGLEGIVPSSLFHFKEKGEARITPFGRGPGEAVLPSWVGVVGCVEPLDKGLTPPFEERPPNLGSLDTMANLMGAFSSIRCQQRHGGAWKHTPGGKNIQKDKFEHRLNSLMPTAEAFLIIPETCDIR